MPGKEAQARVTPRLGDATRLDGDDGRRARVARLSPRSRALVEAMVWRAELSIADIARQLGLSETNARTRLRREVYPAHGLDVESRSHLVSLYRDVVGSDATTDARAAE